MYSWSPGATRPHLHAPAELTSVFGPCVQDPYIVQGDRRLQCVHTDVPVSLDQAVAHGDEEAIHHFGGEILLAARALAYEECQILFCNGRQGARPPIRDVVGAVVREGQKSVISCF